MALDPLLIGRRITEIREKAGVSLTALAESAGIAKSYLLKLERGEVENPGLATLNGVARALGLSLAHLIEGPAARNARKGIEPAYEWEVLERTISPELQAFLSEQDASEPIPTDLKVALAKVQFRGKRPRTKQDWQLIYFAIRNSIGRS